MVESLKELNKICQKPRYKEAGNWMVRHILRDAALPVTWLLLHTPVTANQVTLASCMIGLGGIFLLSFPGKGFFLAGMLALQLWYYLDHVDGQIARYRKTDSLSGRFFDFMTHHLIHGTVFFALGYYGFRVTGSEVFLFWGFGVSMAMMVFNLCQDTRHKTFYERICALGRVEVLATRESSAQEAEDDEAAVQAVLPMRDKTAVKKIFSLAHKAVEIHVLMNALTAAALLTLLAGDWADLRFVAFLLYGCGVPALAAVKTAYLITCRRVDREFEQTFRSSESP